MLIKEEIREEAKEQFYNSNIKSHSFTSIEGGFRFEIFKVKSQPNYSFFSSFSLICAITGVCSVFITAFNTFGKH